MGVGEPVYPDYGNMSANGTEYPLAIDSGMAAQSRIGYNFAPYQTDPVSLSIRVAPGAVWNGVSLTEQPEQISPTISPPAVNPRKDLAVVQGSSGVLSIVTGVEDAAPTLPDTPLGSLPICEINMVPGMLQILDADLRDVRVASSVSLGGTELIETIDIGVTGPAPTFDFVTRINNEFDQYELRLSGLQADVTAANGHVRMRLSVDGGATWLTSAYKWTLYGRSTATAMGENSMNDSRLDLTGASANGRWGVAPASYNGVITIGSPSVAAIPKAVGWRVWWVQSSNIARVDGSGMHGTPSAVNGFQILQSTAGNFSGGSVSLYGLKR